MDQRSEESLAELVLDRYLTDFLIKIGCKIKQAGFYYIKDAIIHVFKYGFCHGCLKDIYKSLADKYETTFTVIQGGIRRFVDIFCTFADPKRVNAAFGIPVYYPNTGLPVSEFIALVAEHLKSKFIFYDNKIIKIDL